MKTDIFCSWRIHVIYIIVSFRLSIKLLISSTSLNPFLPLVASNITHSSLIHIFMAFMQSNHTILPYMQSLLNRIEQEGSPQAVSLHD